MKIINKPDKVVKAVLMTCSYDYLQHTEEFDLVKNQAIVMFPLISIKKKNLIYTLICLL